jgi:ATP/maltotriose-dependent transcriptional regulator MalT/DNA-binding SARP family transcriptional activator
MINIAPVLLNSPSNKFYPPRIDASQSLLRTDLITTRLPATISAKKVIVIEAQAGQGKTTLASQFLNFHQLGHIWYQIGPEDSDPFFLLSSLLLNLSSRFPEFSSFQLSAILSEGQVGPLDIERCVNIMLRDIDTFLPQEIFVVFDDIHLLSGSLLTQRLLEYLLDTSPPKLHFLLTSRHPLQLKSKILRNGHDLCYLNTDDLALGNREIETLFNSVLKKKISRQEVDEIFRVTGGWIMGIILAGHPIFGREKFWQTASGPVSALSSGQGHLLEFFQDEIFDQIPESLHIPFLKLSLLAEIPVNLAWIITAIKDIDVILYKMARSNFFVYQLDQLQLTFRFHHFFQEFLQLRARHLLSEDDIRHIHICEAEYYLEREMIDKAMSCFKMAGDYTMMEKIVKDKGMDLIVRNKTLSLLSLLETIPETTLFQHSWLTLYAGLVRFDSMPKTALPFFAAARARFKESGEETGEIACLSQTIYYHFVISGQYKSAALLLPRTEELLSKNETTLPIPVKIMATRNLASGFCFFKAEMDRARTYIVRATNLAGRHDLRNFTAASRFIQGFIELLSGNQAKFLKDAEICFSLLHDPLVSMANKLTIRIMYLCYHAMIGDHLNFSAEKLAIQKSIDPNVVEQSMAAPYLYVWGSSILFSSGQTEEAMEFLSRARGITATAATDHVRSQIMQWQAFGHALLGEKQDALVCINQSIQLRARAGGPIYETFNAIIAGSVYSRLGMPELAESSFEQGLTKAQSIPSNFLLICAYLNRSYHKLCTAGPAAAVNDLKTGIVLMKNHNFRHFWTWEPKMMIELLGLAVQKDIEREFSRDLAGEKLDIYFSDSREIIPYLHFSLLDHFQISSGRQAIFQASDFTPSQRYLLGLLLTTKGQRISQERVQLEIWPDSPPENARTSFDTLLTRLRKQLSSRLTLPVKRYISLQKGILELSNSRTDAIEFLEAAQTGLRHSRDGNWWQAGNAFRTALAHLKGLWPEDAFSIEQSLTLNDQIINTLAEITWIWAGKMSGSGNTEEAITLLEHTLQSHFQDERLIALLYSLYLKNHNHLKAGDTLERYGQALKRLDYTENEIEELLSEIVAFSLSDTKSRR